jgi:hypothetical protein
MVEGAPGGSACGGRTTAAGSLQGVLLTQLRQPRFWQGSGISTPVPVPGRGIPGIRRQPAAATHTNAPPAMRSSPASKGEPPHHRRRA